jgi:hypothetical protein
VIDHKQLKDAEYFKHLFRMITSGGYCTCEINSAGIHFLLQQMFVIIKEIDSCSAILGTQLFMAQKLGHSKKQVRYTWKV